MRTWLTRALWTIGGLILFSGWFPERLAVAVGGYPFAVIRPKTELRVFDYVPIDSFQLQSIVFSRGRAVGCIEWQVAPHFLAFGAAPHADPLAGMLFDLILTVCHALRVPAFILIAGIFLGRVLAARQRRRQASRAARGEAVTVPEESAPITSILRRAIVVCLRSGVIVAMSLFSLGLAAVSLALVYKVILHLAALHGSHGDLIAFLLAFLIGTFAIRLGWLCRRGAAVTVLIAKGETPALLDQDMPVSFSSFLMLILMAFILAASAMPMFSGLIRKSGEGASKGRLGAVRSALKIFYGDNNGRYPMTLDALTVGGKYLAAIPSAKTPPYHSDSSQVRYGTVPNDQGGWLYDNVPGDADFGKLMVNCTHTDTRGKAWTSY